MLYIKSPNRQRSYHQESQLKMIVLFDPNYIEAFSMKYSQNTISKHREANNSERKHFYVTLYDNEKKKRC